MALIFMDGFDHYNSSEINQKWSSGSGTIVPGRTGNGVTGCTGLYRNFYQNGGVFTVGCAMTFPSLIIPGSTPTYTNTGVAFYTNGAPSIILGINEVGAFVVYAGPGNPSLADNAGALLISSDNGLLYSGVYYYFELEVNLGTATLTGQVNGVQVFSGAVDAENLPDYINGIGFWGGYYGGLICTIDDLYVIDNTGEVNNSFIGDVRVVTLPVIANGRINQWNIAGAPTNWQAVEGAPGALGNTPDGDVAYAYTATPGAIDTYRMGPLPYTGNVKGVQMVADMRKDNSGTRIVTLGVGNGSEEAFPETPNPYIVANEYLYDLQQYDTNPVTDAYWQIADFDTLQSAVKLYE
jgi:hypothetical protein